MGKRIGIVYKDNYAGALALFMKLEKEQKSKLNVHSISSNSYAKYEDGTVIETFKHTDENRRSSDYDILYVDKYINNLNKVFFKVAAGLGGKPKISMF